MKINKKAFLLGNLETLLGLTQNFGVRTGMTYPTTNIRLDHTKGNSHLPSLVSSLGFRGCTLGVSERSIPDAKAQSKLTTHAVTVNDSSVSQEQAIDKLLLFVVSAYHE